MRKKTLIKIAFGKKVREKRVELGWSQERLAEEADLHPTYIGSIERGERNVPLENILKLAAALRCHSGELFPN